MPITRRELIEEFGSACDIGSAGLFVGAGLSAAAGLPGWASLLEEPRVESDVPPMPHDLPLLAEYILLKPTYSRARLEQHILDSTMAAGVDATDSHEALARLGVDQVWTTNYDPLIERADRAALIISSDEDVQLIGTARKTIIKMHGSINPGGPTAMWDDPPVITRSDYETYEDRHPRLWALLRASYLSKTLLFLGFSFADPNIEILQRLARRHGTAAGDRHVTVMRRPDSSAPDDLRRHILKVRDLEASGVRVHEVASYDHLPGLLTALVRRTRPPRLFISGSTTDEDFDLACVELARVLADRLEWEVCSLGGRAGWSTTREIARIRRAEGTYDASRLVFHSRRKDGPPPVEMDERVGTSVFDDLEREPLVHSLLDESRAVLVLGGGARTAEEIEWATQRGLGVVPVAASGGTARDYWEAQRNSPPDLGGRETDRDTWDRLGGDRDVAARAARVLLAQAMYYNDKASARCPGAARTGHVLQRQGHIGSFARSRYGSRGGDGSAGPSAAPPGPVLSVVANMVPNMAEIRTVGLILAALELAPAEPSDVTAVLLHATDRQVLFGRDKYGEPLTGDDPACAKPSEVTPLARYLADHIDHGRVEYWTKVVDRGVSEGRYRALAVTDPGYPFRLREAWDAPPLLFCSIGAPESFTQEAPQRQNLGEALSAHPSLAIVGSRETSRQVVEAAEHAASDLAATGVTIVSGLAAGVDTAAHRGALAAKGYTVAVMGTGIDLVFPQSNRGLAADIRRDGTLVSQFAPSAPRTRTSFLLRNHVIAAMSDASLVMDGEERSGTRYEVERAIQYGRPVFAWAPALSRRHWVQELVAAGSVHLVESAGEVREHLARSACASGA